MLAKGCNWAVSLALSVSLVVANSLSAPRHLDKPSASIPDAGKNSTHVEDTAPWLTSRVLDVELTPMGPIFGPMARIRMADLVATSINTIAARPRNDPFDSLDIFAGRYMLAFFPQRDPVGGFTNHEADWVMRRVGDAIMGGPITWVVRTRTKSKLARGWIGPRDVSV